ncbi:pentatricopeptide repeat-containing protein At1g18900 [Momordica charantia]|uniref:Pentatricopeptide repeat-containing protein At1g18900 n=1 Tax=Momordica charantia TaxID=3673 RepID=A0A6J1C013_MOMCH|nr:pentatricopeptide repeat-containing protein At1g18900 [Momordica charantia]
MLRAKQIGSLSSSARSFFLSGSRCNGADGSSCTCSEDETCVSQRQNARIEILPSSKPSTLVARPNSSARLGTLIAEDAAKVIVSHKTDKVDLSIAVRPVTNTGPSPQRGPECVRYASGLNTVLDDECTSPKIADQFVKAGIVAVNLFSDFVNFKVPLSDYGGTFSSSKNCMVDPARSITSVKPSKVKHLRRENISSVHSKPSVDIPVDSKPQSSSSHHGPKCKSEKSNYVKGLKQVPEARTRKPVVFHNMSSDKCDKRILPQRSRIHLNSFTSHFHSNAQTMGSEFTNSSKNLNKLPDNIKSSMGMAPTTMQLSSTSHAVESVFCILQQLKWGPTAEEALGKLNCSIDVYQANQVLKRLDDYSVALGFFNWLKRLPRFRHDGHTYTTMIGLLGRAKQFGAINKLLDQMVKDGCQPNVVTYNRIIHSYGRANYLQEAVDVFKQMQEAGCEPDRVTYCTLIDIHAKSGFLDIAMGMYERMQEAGLTPDTFTYSVMINCLGKAGHLNAAHRLFCRMVDQGCVPNLVTYNIMIALQAKARNYEIALKLYRDMQQSGFEPDKVTYCIVMEVLGHCGFLEEAESIFIEMQKKNWVPDEPVYGLLVDLWGKSGNVQKAWEWYHVMLNAGLKPNVPTCNSLLSAFLRVHQLSDAYQLLQSMLHFGLKPSLQTYTLLLSCCTDAQSTNDMGFCCELMQITGHPAHTFLVSLPSAGPNGQNVRDHMNTFLDLMHSEDRESKRGLVDAVVDFLHKSGLKEEAGCVWEAAMQKNVYPDAVKEKSNCYWLINLHVMSEGTAVTALSRTLAWFRQQMLHSGVSPSRIDIVTGWGRRSRVTGSSLVRQAVQDLLNIFSFPFFTENGNSGCFVGCGEPLSRWLHQSYVERMHLL